MTWDVSVSLKEYFDLLKSCLEHDRLKPKKKKLYPSSKPPAFFSIPSLAFLSIFFFFYTKRFFKHFHFVCGINLYETPSVKKLWQKRNIWFSSEIPSRLNHNCLLTRKAVPRPQFHHQAVPQRTWTSLMAIWDGRKSMRLLWPDLYERLQNNRKCKLVLELLYDAEKR